MRVRPLRHDQAWEANSPKRMDWTAGIESGMGNRREERKGRHSAWSKSNDEHSLFSHCDTIRIKCQARLPVSEPASPQTALAGGRCIPFAEPSGKPRVS